MELLLVLIIIGIFVLSFVLKSSSYKGKVGERKVSNKLSKLIDEDSGCIAFHNITLRTPDGSTQIDHVLLSQCGIFIVETKNMKGWIFGGDRQKKWTQVIFKKKTTFQNPIHQNYKHVKAIQNLLSVKKNVIYNVVVFVGDVKFKTKMPANVLKTKKLVPYIKSHSQQVFDRGELEHFRHLIDSVMSGKLVTDKQHRKNVKQSRKNPLCPICGTAMILRVARKGNKKGKEFWGCSNFPACRGTKNIG